MSLLSGMFFLQHTLLRAAGLAGIPVNAASPGRGPALAAVGIWEEKQQMEHPSQAINDFE